MDTADLTPRAEAAAAEGRPAAAPAITLYGRPGCHLCDEARVVLARVCAEAGLAWRELDVDDPPEPGGRDLLDEYGDLVPVVEVDGREVARWRVTETTLRRALAVASSPVRPG